MESRMEEEKAETKAEGWLRALNIGSGRDWLFEPVAQDWCSSLGLLFTR